MASATVATSPSNHNEPPPQHCEEFVMTMMHLVSLQDMQPPKGRGKERRDWQAEIDEARSDAIRELFECLPAGTRLEHDVLVNMLVLAQYCMRGGMVYREMGEQATA